ncbi:CCA tRNA nucleotidyltransferase [Staphylococcus canis]|uniref:CCA-adding enzyme n=1 Tax=Staphylococcus canis TaxID=2724942 RepID=A0ABS0TAB7_9STAP|nr:CCA tRNA nucleotidyltransferase [Staphylococcus canis]MBI5975367.1 CCA tRNA nucleotidyltransferase [Staphylococcus canis]
MEKALPFLRARPILEHIQNNGYDAFFVGGSVRDYIMNRPINDVDITTSATPDEIESLFSHTIPVGKEHGTINVVWEHENYEITTFRTESEYINHRRPSSVQYVRDLYLDVERRDFTINAIAMDTNFKIYDYFNGQLDIERKVIRTVGAPEARFSEDALRILRGLRFKSQLGFKIEDQTYNAMRNAIEDIQYLSIERIIIELKKLMTGFNVSQVLKDLNALQLWHQIPFFNALDINRVHITQPLTLEQFVAISQYILQSTSSLKSLKLSNASTHYISKFILALNYLNQINNHKHLSQFVYDFGLDLALEVSALRNTLEANAIQLPSQSIFHADSIRNAFNALPIQNRKMLNINGKDLMESLNKKSGPWLKTVLRELECAVVQNYVDNSKQEMIEWVKSNVKIS